MIILPSSAGIYRPVVSSGPTPPISANLALWFNANYGVTASGGTVSQINDLSGNARHATQATGTKQPALTANARKTNSMMTFDGVNDAITFNGLTLTGDFTIYWVGTINEAPDSTSAYFTESDSGASNLSGLNNFNQGTYWYNGGSDILQGNSGRVYQNSLDIIVVRRTGSTITCEVNDLDNSSSPTNSNPTIGAIGPAFTGYSQMQFGEMLVYTSHHGTTDKNTVVNALKSTWKFPTLPVSGAALWLDGSRWDTLFTTDTGSTNVTTNAGAIGRWEDLSGNARHATQATAGSRPTWASPANGQNGLATISFNGSQFLQSAYTTRPATLIVVGKQSGTGNRCWAGNDSTNGGAYGGWQAKAYNPSAKLAFNVSSSTGSIFEVANPAISTNELVLHVTQFDGTTLYSGKNNGAFSTASFSGTPSTGSVGTNIGCAFYNRGNVDFINGSIYEMIMYESVLSSSQLTSLYNHLKTKWNLP